MISKHANSIAHTLNANVAPIELVLDMADTLEDSRDLGVYPGDREQFVTKATQKLVESLATTDRMITAAVRR